MENSGINRIVQPTPRKRSSPKWPWLALILISGLAGYYFFLGGKALLSPENENSYQAVFLTNGQVYFGKLSSGWGWSRLEDVYYLKATSALEATGNTADAATLTDAQKKIELVKLGAELHGPENIIYIEKGQILFWENMKDGSKVLEAIKQYKSAAN